MTGSDSEHDPILEEAMDWLLRLEAAPHDRAVQEELAAWRGRSAAHDQAYRRVTRMWRLAGDLPSDYAEREDFTGPLSRSRPAAGGRPARGSRATKSRFRRPVAVAGFAAVLAACLVLLLHPSLLFRLQADHATGVAETRSIVLDDGSRLQLAAESAIAVGFDGGQRRVTLIAGQAFFDVAHEPERPFTVEAEGLAVTVTGTAFAVGLNRERVSVAVAAGAVEVVSADDGAAAYRLVPGDRLTMASATDDISRARVALADIAAWRRGQMIVAARPLADVIEEIGRYHRGAILLEDAALGERRITGVFSLQNPIAALEAAAGTQGAEVAQFTPYVLVVRPK